MFAGSSNGFDRGQRAAAEARGVICVSCKKGAHAEENLMREVPDLKPVGTSKRSPCGPSAHNCAGQLANRGVGRDQIMETKTLESLSLDEALDVLQSGMAGMSRRQQAAFFGVSGEALFPLYLQFVKQTGWGDPDILRSAAHSALGFATGGEPIGESTNDLLTSIAAVTPDGERFDAPESTFAQDVAICIDAAVRSTDTSEEVNPAWIEYVLEPATIMASEEQTGYIDPGASAAGKEWRATALKHPGLRTAFETCSELLRILKSKESVSPSDLADLRLLAAGLFLHRNNA